MGLCCSYNGQDHLFSFLEADFHELWLLSFLFPLQLFFLESKYISQKSVFEINIPRNFQRWNAWFAFLSNTQNRNIIVSDHVLFNPFTPESDQCQNSPAASQEIWHHTVWRTWLFIAYSDQKWLYYKFSLHHSYNRFLKGWENTLFELRSERVKIQPNAHEGSCTKERRKWMKFIRRVKYNCSNAWKTCTKNCRSERVNTNVLVSFPRIPFPETIQIPNKRLLSLLLRLLHRIIVLQSIYGCKRARQFGLTANGCSRAHRDFTWRVITNCSNYQSDH